MSDTINVHLKDIPYLMRYQALDAAENFAMQYPERVGVRNASVYRALNAVDSIYVYRTKAGRIVAAYNPAPTSN